MRPSGVRFTYSATNSGACVGFLHAARDERVDADAEWRAYSASQRVKFSIPDFATL